MLSLASMTGLEEALRAELAASRREARWVRRRLEGDLARMVHDLKAPLSAVKGYVEMLLRGMAGPLSPDASRYLERIREVIDREREMIDTRLRPRGDRGLAVMCDLGRTLEAALARSHRAVQARGLVVRADLLDAASPVMARPSLLLLFARRLVRHLVGAAAPGGAVSLAVHDEVGRWAVEASADGDRGRGRDLLLCREAVERLGGTFHPGAQGQGAIRVLLPQGVPD